MVRLVVVHGGHTWRLPLDAGDLTWARMLADDVMKFAEAPVAVSAADRSRPSRAAPIIALAGGVAVATVAFGLTRFQPLSFMAFMFLAAVAAARPAAPAAFGLGTIALANAAWLAMRWHDAHCAAVRVFLPSAAVFGGLGVVLVVAGIFQRRHRQKDSDGFRLAVGALIVDLALRVALALFARHRGFPGATDWLQMSAPSGLALLAVGLFGRRRGAPGERARR